jgi:hypothetical protein
MPDYEIDHGEPDPAPAASSAPAQPAVDPGAVRRAEEARTAAVASIQGAERQRHLVDMLALAVAGLCGQGLGGATRVDEWNGGDTLGVLAALAGLGVAGWMWRRARATADALSGTPVPLDEDAIRKLSMQDEAKRERERKRRDEEFARIELLEVDLALCCRRLRLAAWGAGAGTACGWLCAITGPAGGMAMAASMAAVPGAILGWRIAGGGWPAQLVQRTAMAALPAAGLAAALMLGTSFIWAPLGAALCVGAGWFWRQRVSDLAGCATEGSEVADVLKSE